MINNIVNEYCRKRELKRSTESTIRAIAKVYSDWAGLREFNADSVSDFLRYKQEQGLSAYYRRSLRSTLTALLRFAGDKGQVRPVKRQPIELDTWDANDVRKIISAVSCSVPSSRVRWWESLIAAAWYTGLSKCDLLRLKGCDIEPDGTFTIRRQKTNALVFAWIPPDLKTGDGLLWPWKYGKETFRTDWNKITKSAGVIGPFKKLRRSSGTNIEKLFPGQGHVHLANQRAIFERHYLNPVRRSVLIPEKL